MKVLKLLKKRGPAETMMNQITFTLEGIFLDSSQIQNILHGIRFSVYTQIGESEMKTSRLLRVFGDFESET